jgi:hypothetical protein
MNKIIFFSLALFFCSCHSAKLDHSNTTQSSKFDSLDLVFSDEKLLYGTSMDIDSSIFILTYSRPFDTCFVFHIYKFDGLVMARFTYYPTDYYNDELPNPNSADFAFSSKSTVVTLNSKQVESFIEKVKAIPKPLVVNGLSRRFLHAPDIKLFFSGTFYTTKNNNYEYFDLVYAVLEKEFISLITKRLK